jgi:sugar phosphate isomerase/epimerase
MIRFSCSEYSFPQLSPAQRLALLQFLGFNYVDIGLFESGNGFRIGLLLMDPKQFTKHLKRDLKRTGLEVSDIFLRDGIRQEVSSANDHRLLVRSRNRKLFLLAIDLCAAIGCVHIASFSGIRHKDKQEVEGVKLAKEEASWRQCLASGAGVCYAIRPHAGSLCPDVAGTHEFIKAVPGLTLALDYRGFAHAGANPCEIQSLLPFASHIDVPGGAPNQQETEAEESLIEISSIIRGLHELRYDGFLVIDYGQTSIKASYKHVGNGRITTHSPHRLAEPIWPKLTYDVGLPGSHSP